MASKLERATTFPLLNINGRARLTLMGILACTLLVCGFILLLQTPVQAFVSKGTSCSAATCHGATEATATITAALNGTQGTAITVSPGSTLEVDWIYTNLRNTTKYDGTQPEIAIPTGWTIARGTANSPALSGWNPVWDLTGGVTTGWNVTYSTAGEFANSPLGYSIDYAGTTWDSGTRNAAADNATAADLDGVANRMGADARITVPAGASPGSYTIMVLGIGHNSGDTKAHIEQAITVTVSAAAAVPVEIGGTLAVTPLSGTFVDSPMTITENFTTTTAPSGCRYTLNNWGSNAAGVTALVSGTTYSCTASGVTSTNGTALTIAMDMTNGTGTSTHTATLARTVDTAVPTDGAAAMTATAASSTQINLAWPAASDGTGSGLNTTLPYKLVRATGATAPTDCTGTALYNGTALTYNDTTVTASTQYSYRVCAYDRFNHVSTGKTVTAATQTASVTNSPATYDGTAKAATVTCSGGGIASSILTGGAASQTNAGTYAVTATCPANGIYSAVTGLSAGNFIINKAVASAAVTNSPVTYDTTAKAAAVTCTGGGAASSILTGGAATQTTAGTYPVTANCATSTNYLAGTAVAAGNFIINPATPTASISNTPVIYTGSAQTAVVACLGGGTATLASGGTGTNVGSYPATVNCAASTNYSAASGLSAGSFVINAATTTASITNSPVIYTGSAQTAVVACLGGGTATLASGGTGTNAGSYPATANCAASTNYSAASGISAGSFVINQATPTASISNSPVTYNTSPQAAAVTCLGGGAVSNILYNGSGTVPTNAATYAVTTNCAASTNYSAATALPAGSFVIDKATPTLTVTNTPVVYDGSAKSATVSGSVAGTPSSILTGGAASQTAVGNYPVTANFTPTDTVNYNSLTAASAGNFVISAATQTATVTNSPRTYNTSPQAAAVTCSGAGAVSNIRYNGSGTVPTNAATYPILVDCAANGSFSATSNVAAGDFIINKATPTLSIGNPTVTYNGSAQAATVNGLVAGSATSILYNGSATVPTNAAIYAVTANFTPTDTANYNSLTAASAGNFTISKAPASASISNPTVTYNTSPQAAAVTCLGGGAVSNILYNGSATVPTNAATYAVTTNCATSTNYLAGTAVAAGSFVINKATPTLSVTNTPVVYDGSAKSATVSGSVAGTPSSILTGGAASQTAVGTYAVTANFTPTDTVNYTTLTAAPAGNFVISAATQTATVTNSPVTYNTSPQAAVVTCSGAGAVSNIRYNGSGTVPTNAATYAIVVDCAANGGFSATSNVAAGNFIINKATPTLSIGNPTVTYNGSAQAATVNGSVAGSVTSVLYNGSATVPTNAATYAVTANFTPTDTVNYNSLTASAAGTFIINKAAQTIGVITFTPATLAVAGTTTASATATSGLTVNFSSDTLPICTVSGNTVTGVSAGTCTIRAIQVGNVNWNAASPEVTQSLAVTSGSTNATLTITTAGAGSGTVYSSPGTIACASGNLANCSDTTFTVPTDVTLTAAPDWKSEVVWSGGCTGTGLSCGPFTLNGNTGVTATFNFKQLVMIPGPVYYATVQDAYNAAAADAVLKVRDQAFTENLVFNGVNVTFDGGYEATWATANGFTAINGDVTIITGGVTVSNMVIQ